MEEKQYKGDLQGWVSGVRAGVKSVKDGLMLPSVRGSGGCCKRASSVLVAGVPTLSGW